MNLLLASTSRYRKKLLERLCLPFACRDPGVDEHPLHGESPQDLAARLAMAKARAVGATAPDAWVLGSDQVAALDGQCMGKPGVHAAAAAQLQASSGKTVEFFTAVALVRGEPAHARCEVHSTRVTFRTLEDAEIERYLAAETPYDCAGSFKCEGLGIALFERIESDDPTALEGLPLITTCRLLRAAGFTLP
ncbi:septum formation inhibitor Maf [Mangrovimicrobium sediminis]|uniref:7-methyl-GTP pyrophosphatase n=1 Tax=Mangrovimicrobium sediminis TaxID=2562682 RepID=A0A4Z0M285_9GAMM|nr:Maf family nucleotide pyrophosphatase [Haliea sp. SAOS-164]TGD73639.1 septum formation inhibitor Maf [Haliea sp. SAOS-164]